MYKDSIFDIIKLFISSLRKKVKNMNTNVLLSKTYVNKIVSDYREIVNNVDEIIAQTGYKGKLIAQKLGISESSFYQKKRMKTFSLNEIEKIVDLMDEDDEDIEDEYFMKLYEDEYFMKLYKDRENEFKREPIIENIIDVLMDDVKKREKNERDSQKKVTE
jgi:hypothetical protein